MSRSGIFIFVIILFLAGAWIGVTWFGLGERANEYSQFFEQKVILDGYVVSDPQKYGAYQKRFEVLPESLHRQKILVSTFSRNDFAYGDKVYIVGKLKEPKNFGDYDYVHYLEAKGVYAQISGNDIFVVGKSKLNLLIFYSLKIKHFVYRKFQQNLPKEQSALLIALIVGQKDLMSKETVQAFTATGTAHLIAVSGYILTLLLAFAASFGPRIGKKKTLAVAAAIAFIYMVMADFAAGVIRAALMAGLYAGSKALNRQYALLLALAASAALLVAINPLIIKYDIGFMLSFLSLLGITLFAPPLENVLRFLPEKLGIRQTVSITLAAQVITAPLTVYYFGQFSILAPLANLLIIPTIEPLLLTAYFLVLPGLGAIIGKILLVPLNYILFMIIGLAAVPHASAAAHLSASGMVFLYIAEAALYLLKYRSTIKKIINRII